MCSGGFYFLGGNTNPSNEANNICVTSESSEGFLFAVASHQRLATVIHPSTFMLKVGLRYGKY